MSTTSLMLLFALLPIVILLIHIYVIDKYQKEPIGKIVLSFMAGVASLFIALVLVHYSPLTDYIESVQGLGSGVLEAFFNAAIPEELAKLFMLWLVLRRNRYFDEKVDGIVYAVSLSLGFAAFENLLYIFQNYPDWENVAVMRAIFAVPGHYCYGVLMGYFYSKVKFASHPSVKDMVMVLLAPVLAHGIYDSLLFEMENINPGFVLFLSSLFVIFTILLWKHSKKKIREHLNADKEFFDRTTID